MTIMKQRGVRVILTETWFPEGVAQAVARQTGARLLKLPVLPGGVQGRDTYVEMMDYVVDQIAGALQ